MILSGKRGIVFGVSSKYSLGFHISKAWCQAGCSKLIIACENQELCLKVTSIAKKEGWWDEQVCSSIPCDVNNDEQLAQLFEMNETDMIMHSVAYAPTEALRNPLTNLSRKDFLKTMQTSAYSLIAISSMAKFPEQGGSITALTFSGSQRVVPGYGVMAPAKAALETISKYLAYELATKGIRVNCISPGPVNTPAARALPSFHSMLQQAKERNFLKRDVSPTDVAQMSVFLASDLASGITGQVYKVDCGES